MLGLSGEYFKQTHAQDKALSRAFCQDNFLLDSGGFCPFSCSRGSVPPLMAWFSVSLSCEVLPECWQYLRVRVTKRSVASLAKGCSLTSSSSGSLGRRLTKRMVSDSTAFCAGTKRLPEKRQCLCDKPVHVQPEGSMLSWFSAKRMVSSGCLRPPERFTISTDCACGPDEGFAVS